jgi:hypothetical protein
MRHHHLQGMLFWPDFRLRRFLQASVRRPRKRAMCQGKDRLTGAERHVREGEARLARQAELIEKLERSGHLRMAAQARILLVTLETSLQLASEEAVH